MVKQWIGLPKQQLHQRTGTVPFSILLQCLPGCYSVTQAPWTSVWWFILLFLAVCRAVKFWALPLSIHYNTVVWIVPIVADALWAVADARTGIQVASRCANESWTISFAVASQATVTADFCLAVLAGTIWLRTIEWCLGGWLWSAPNTAQEANK